jgi:hypothetical protein
MIATCDGYFCSWRRFSWCFGGQRRPTRRSIAGSTTTACRISPTVSTAFPIAIAEGGALGLKNAPAASGPAAGAKASGETTIRFIPGQRIMVDARINGNADAKLMLDTGSDKTLISPRALQAAGVRITGSTTSAEVAGATGTGRMQFVEVDSLEIGEARVGRMPVASQDVPIDGADGVLGRDFLDQFNVNIDGGKGVVTLSPR